VVDHEGRDAVVPPAVVKGHRADPDLGSLDDAPCLLQRQSSIIDGHRARLKSELLAEECDYGHGAAARVRRDWQRTIRVECSAEPCCGKVGIEVTLLAGAHDDIRSR
jgi:hypothetical protein